MGKRTSNSILSKIFAHQSKIKSVLVKRLAKNDDSGRHGVLVPIESYPMFPSFPNFDPEAKENYTASITTEWNLPEKEIINSKFKHYHRYPERRLTCLKTVLNDREPRSLIVIGGISKDRFEIHVIQPSNPKYKKILKECELPESDESVYFVNLKWKQTKALAPKTETSIARFLKKFDKIKRAGPIKTLRQGDTGIGYTFETILGIQENNLSGPDFEDIEIKCFSKGRNSNSKKNLFLKEPKWIDSFKSMKDRLPKYGYFDKENNRNALYSSVTSKTNSHGFKFSVSWSEEKVFLNYKNRKVAFWTFSVLEGCLSDKHEKAVFVAAKKTTKNGIDYFHYQEVSYCTNPFIGSFVNLIENGQVILELRMHQKESGTVRNHGTCFRVLESHIPELYSKVAKLR